MRSLSVCRSLSVYHRCFKSLSGMPRLVFEDLGEAEEIPLGCQDQSSKLGHSPLDIYHPRLRQRSVPLRTFTEIMELDFVDNSDKVGDSIVQVSEVSVHQGTFGVTSAILVSEQAPTMNTVVPAPRCATVLMCAPLPLQGPTVSVPLLVNSNTNHNALAFPPMASTPMLFL